MRFLKFLREITSLRIPPWRGVDSAALVRWVLLWRTRRKLKSLRKPLTKFFDTLNFKS